MKPYQISINMVQLQVRVYSCVNVLFTLCLFNYAMWNVVYNFLSLNKWSKKEFIIHEIFHPVQPRSELWFVMGQPDFMERVSGFSAQAHAREIHWTWTRYRSGIHRTLRISSLTTIHNTQHPNTEMTNIQVRSGLQINNRRHTRTNLFVVKNKRRKLHSRLK
jgi:hypothetical protein